MKGRPRGGGGRAQGRHRPEAHTGTGVHCCPAWLGFGAGLAGVWSPICRFFPVVEKSFSAQEGGSNLGM